MSERQLQFRVGLFVIISVVIGVCLTIQFGKLNTYWEPRYLVGIEFEELSGVQQGTPVLQSGIPIGQVHSVTINRKSRRVMVVAEIRERHTLAADSKARLIQSLLGDAHIDFSIGASQEVCRPGTIFQGEMPHDPLAAVQELELRMEETMRSFTVTSQEWQKVARNVNAIVETNQGSIEEMVEKAAVSLQALTVAMQKASVTLDQANHFIADPELQISVKQAMLALPQLVQQTDLLIRQTQQTIQTTNSAVGSLGNTMSNLETVTAPLAANSENLVLKLNSSLNSLDQTLTQLARFSTQLNEGEGSIQRLSTDPQLYQNLQVSSAALASLLRNLEPIMRDMRIFSDKVARHPEVLGVSGYLKGSSGIKEATITPASATAPSNIRGYPQPMP
ncbi:MAG: MCE family protein [Planctomycetaceae bacterium]|nr:MCE family protein [Planctomycetaceae bacterium]